MIDHCEACGRDCSTGEGCTFTKIEFGDGTAMPRLRYVGDEPCSDCGVFDGGVHHFNCQKEVCPRCEGKFVDCGCIGDDSGTMPE